MKDSVKSLKQRKVDVYPPSLVMRDRWKQAADKKEMTLSKFVIESVENQIREEKEYSSRSELLKKIDALQEENIELRRKKNQQNIVIDKLQEELQVYRMQPFLEEGFKGVRRIEKRLVDLLREKTSVRADDLYKELGVNPRNSDAMKAISKELQRLERYGLVTMTHEGWKWKR